METIDEILRNFKADPEHYNHGASANGKQPEQERFDDMRC